MFSSEINTFCKITRPVNELVLFLQVKIIDILFTPYLVLLLFRNDDDDDYLAHIFNMFNISSVVSSLSGRE